MVKQMRALGMAIPFMGGDGVYTAEFLKLAGKDAEGVIGSLPGIPLANMTGGPEFKQKFEAKYGVIQLYAPYVYDATRMLVPGLRRQIVKELGGPAVYAVPLESVFVALTRNYAPVIKSKVLQEFTTGKNPLSPELFEERNGELVPIQQ